MTILYPTIRLILNWCCSLNFTLIIALYKENQLGIFWAFILLLFCVLLVNFFNLLLPLEKKIQDIQLRRYNQLSFTITFVIWLGFLITLDLLKLKLGLHSYYLVFILYITIFGIIFFTSRSKRKRTYEKFLQTNRTSSAKLSQSSSPQNDEIKSCDEEARPIILKIENLKVYFDTEEGIVRAVENINLEVYQDEILGLVGETGCGKSVTALSIMKLVKPPGKIVSGKIVFENQNLLEKSEKEMLDIRGNKISMIFQDPLNSLNPVFKIGEQIQEVFLLHQKQELMNLVAHHDKVKSDIVSLTSQLTKLEGRYASSVVNFSDRKKEIVYNLTKLKEEFEKIKSHESIFKIAREKAIEMLKKVRISDPETIIDRYPFELSGGMRQRVMIAIALACQPRLLIADEPTTALDVSIQAQILKLIRDLQTQFHTSVIIITHDLGVISDICDRVAVMYSGYIVEHGDVYKLFKHPTHPYTRALLESIPRYNKLKPELKIIPGKVPNLIYPPKGCRFHPRCEYSSDTCLECTPDLQLLEKDYYVACYMKEQLCLDKNTKNTTENMKESEKSGGKNV